MVIKKEVILAKLKQLDAVLQELALYRNKQSYSLGAPNNENQRWRLVILSPSMEGSKNLSLGEGRKTLRQAQGDSQYFPSKFGMTDSTVMLNLFQHLMLHKFLRLY